MACEATESLVRVFFSFARSKRKHNLDRICVEIRMAPCGGILPEQFFIYLRLCFDHANVKNLSLDTQERRTDDR